jgi:uncharacterized repeat protein (TIGR01451 family)
MENIILCARKVSATAIKVGILSFILVASVLVITTPTTINAVDPVLNVSCSASPVSAEINQPVTFISVVSGGTGSYNYTWTGACTGSASNCTKSFSSAGVYTANVTVTSGSQSRSASCPVNITATPPPPPPPPATLNVSCSASPVTTGVNQNVDFISTVSGGTGVYNYTWTGACSGSGVDCSKSFSTAGVYTANLTVTSGSQSRSASCPVNITATPPPPPATLNVSCSASPVSAEINQSVSFISTVSGGSGAYNYTWTGDCSASSANCTKSFSTAGIYTANLTVTSGSQSRSASCPVNITETPPPPPPATLNVSCSAFPVSTEINQNVNFASTVSGGSGVYNYAWSGACTGSSANCSKSFNTAGIYTANLTVTSGSQSRSASCPVNITNTVATCTVNSDCGTNGFIGGPFCQGNNVYQDYITYACISPGTSASHCTNFTTSQLQTTCTGNQTCSNGTCTTINNCTPNAQQRCFGNNLYWYDSCGNQQGFAQYCANGCYNNACQNGGGNYCSYHAYERCNGNNLYWYDSCGNQQDLALFCQNGCYNNTCQYYTVANLLVTKTVKNLTSNTVFSASTNANPGDTLMFMITLRADGQNVQNVFVRDTLPAGLIYQNQLIVARSNNYNNNYNNYSGDIISGINLNTISASQTVTITYQAQVAGAQNFNFGTTTLTNNVYVTSSQSGYNPSSNASVFVTKTGVLGASTISTGLTNNFWVDSFLLPLLIALIGAWMWKSGMFYGIEKWIDNKRKIRKGYKAEKELSARIAKIQKFGSR